MKNDYEEFEKIGEIDPLKKVKECRGMKVQIKSLGKNIDSSSSGVEKYKYEQRYNRASDKYRENC